MLLATGVNSLGWGTIDLEGRQRNGWQRRCIIVECLGGGDSALKLNMCLEIVRCELDIAVLDEVYDTFGKVEDPLARIRARMIDSSHGQRSSNEIDVPFHCTIFAFDLEIRRSKTLLESDRGESL